MGQYTTYILIRFYEQKNRMHTTPLVMWALILYMDLTPELLMNQRKSQSQTAIGEDRFSSGAIRIPDEGTLRGSPFLLTARAPSHNGIKAFCRFFDAGVGFSVAIIKTGVSYSELKVRTN